MRISNAIESKGQVYFCLLMCFYYLFSRIKWIIAVWQLNRAKFIASIFSLSLFFVLYNSVKLSHFLFYLLTILEEMNA